MFQCDANRVMKDLSTEYCFYLNSSDLQDPDLPLVCNKAYGGTMVMWRTCHDPYVDIHPVNSSSILPIILRLPGHQVSVHIAVYLPTHGKDSEFFSELANLRNCIEELSVLLNDPPVYIRGDANVNPKNQVRVPVFKQFIHDFCLRNSPIAHKTYHHFTGNGLYDSNIDILLHPVKINASEVVSRILCINDYPELQSHHDVIMSQFTIPGLVQNSSTADVISAPRIQHTRKKIHWSDDGIDDYANLLKPQLERIRQNWFDPSSQASMSLLMQMNTSVMSKCAELTNKSAVIGAKKVQKPDKVPAVIKKAKDKMNKIHKKLQTIQLDHTSEPSTMIAAKLSFNEARRNYRQTVRKYQLGADMDWDQTLFSIAKNKPGRVYDHIKACRRTKPTQIEKLTVGEKIYLGSAVPDGFYDSMSSLKQCDYGQLGRDPNLADQLSNYQHLQKLLQDQHSIPPISVTQSAELLKRMKKDVKDFYGITALHFTNAGSEGVEHFNCLLNGIIENVSNAAKDMAK